MRNMFGLSFYKMILQACSKAHCSLFLGVRSRIMQSRNKTAAFLKPLIKIIHLKLLLCPNFIHYCTKQRTAVARFRLNQLKPYQVNIYLLYTIPFLISFLIKKRHEDIRYEKCRPLILHKITDPSAGLVGNL